MLKTVNFSAGTLGDTNLLLSTTPGDSTEGFLLEPAGFATFSFDLGHVTVIPEPASLVLLAIAGLGAVCKRRLWSRTILEVPARRLDQFNQHLQFLFGYRELDRRVG